LFSPEKPESGESNFMQNNLKLRPELNGTYLSPIKIKENANARK